MWYEMQCGCTVDVDVYTNYGCCEECGSYPDVENVDFVSNCEAHTATGDAV